MTIFTTISFAPKPEQSESARSTALSASLSTPSEHSARVFSTLGGGAFDSSVSSDEEQPGSAGKSLSPSPSSSIVLEHAAAGGGAVSSLSSELLKHPASDGKSVRPLPSLSIPSEHCGNAGGGF